MREIILKKNCKTTRFTYVNDRSKDRIKDSKKPIGSLLECRSVLLIVLILVVFVSVAPMERINALKELVQAFAGLMQELFQSS